MMFVELEAYLSCRHRTIVRFSARKSISTVRFKSYRFTSVVCYLSLSFVSKFYLQNFAWMT
jgi:hypothetical protein